MRQYENISQFKATTKFYNNLKTAKPITQFLLIAKPHQLGWFRAK